MPVCLPDKKFSAFESNSESDVFFSHLCNTRAGYRFDPKLMHSNWARIRHRRQNNLPQSRRKSGRRAAPLALGAAVLSSMAGAGARSPRTVPAAPASRPGGPAARAGPALPAGQRPRRSAGKTRHGSPDRTARGASGCTARRPEGRVENGPG